MGSLYMSLDYDVMKFMQTNDYQLFVLKKIKGRVIQMCLYFLITHFHFWVNKCLLLATHLPVQNANVGGSISSIWSTIFVFSHISKTVLDSNNIYVWRNLTSLFSHFCVFLFCIIVSGHMPSDFHDLTFITRRLEGNWDLDHL